MIATYVLAVAQGRRTTACQETVCGIGSQMVSVAVDVQASAVRFGLRVSPQCAQQCTDDRTQECRADFDSMRFVSPRFRVCR